MSSDSLAKKAAVHLWYLLLLLLPVQLGSHAWPSTAFILGIKIDYLSPIIYLSDLVIFLLLLFWTTHLIKRREKIRIFHWPQVLIFAFPLSLLFSTIITRETIISWYQTAKITEMSLLASFVATEIQFKKHIPKIVFFLGIGVFWQSILAISQFFAQNSLGFWILGERSFDSQTPGISLVDLDGRQLLRPYGTFPHPNVLGGFLALSLPAMAIASLKAKSQKILPTFVLVVSLLALAITFSRSSWVVGFGGGAAAFFACCFSKLGAARLIKNPKTFFLGIIGVFFLITVLIFIWPYFWQRAVSFTSTDSHSLILRAKLASSAILMFKTSPFWGIGPAQFLPNLPNFFNFAETIRFLQPVHNIFLLVLAESGLLGLIAFLVPVVYLLIKLKNLAKDSSTARILLIGLASLLFLGNIDHYFLTLQQGQLMWWMTIGLLFSFQHQST